MNGPTARDVEAVVTEFDPVIGWGSVRVDHSGETLGFHCLDIADGSREIAAHTAVRCRRVGRLGHWQATQVVPR